MSLTNINLVINTIQVFCQIIGESAEKLINIFYFPVDMNYDDGEIGMVSAGPKPETLKDKLKEDEIPLVIFFDGDSYKIQWTELRNIGLDNYDKCVTNIQEKGLINPVFFGRACHYCNHFTSNIIDTLKIDEVIDQKTYNQGRCGYSGNDVIKIAKPFINKKKKYTIMAIDDACVFDEALIETVRDKGLLEPYRIKETFNYKPIRNFDNEKESDKKYIIADKSLTGQIKKLLHIHI
jgi:hypothetical protein